MLLYGIVLLWLPQIIAFASFLFIVFLMLKAWRATDNQGFLLLAIVTALGELHYLAMKFGGWLLPASFDIHGILFNTWFSAFLGVSAAVSWWLLNRHLAARKAVNDGD